MGRDRLTREVGSAPRVRYDVFLWAGAMHAAQADECACFLKAGGLSCWSPALNLLDSSRNPEEDCADTLRCAGAMVILTAREEAFNRRLLQLLTIAVSGRIPVVELRLEDTALPKAMEDALAGAARLDGRALSEALPHVLALLGARISPTAACPDLNGFQFRPCAGGVELVAYTGGAVRVNIPARWDNARVVAVAPGGFREAVGAEAVLFPSGVERIGTDAFRGCGALRRVELPPAVRHIGAGAFEGCARLTSIDLESTRVTTLREKTFAGCHALRTAVMPGALTAIEREAFRGCTSLESVSLPYPVESIGASAFRNCRALRSVLLPLEAYIAQDAFSGCTDVEFVRPRTCRMALSAAALPPGSTVRQL
jgi:hypothetical protein